MPRYSLLGRKRQGGGRSGVVGSLTEMDFLCVLIIDNNHPSLGECIAQRMESHILGHILETKLITFQVMLPETQLRTTY